MWKSRFNLYSRPPLIPQRCTPLIPSLGITQILGDVVPSSSTLNPHVIYRIYTSTAPKIKPATNTCTSIDTCGFSFGGGGARSDVFCFKISSTLRISV